MDQSNQFNDMRTANPDVGANQTTSTEQLFDNIEGGLKKALDLVSLLKAVVSAAIKN